MRRRGALGAACATFLMAGVVTATQWIVDDDGPADFPSINAALSSPLVAPGDTVLVRPGIYRERIDLYTDLDIVSEAGPLRTIVDARRAGSVVLLHALTSKARIEGFTITGGQAHDGGGVYIEGGSPVVTRNLIVGNTASADSSYGYGGGYGGGIEVHSGSPLITRNVLRGNTADSGGGGIDLYCPPSFLPPACSPVVAGNTITENSVVRPAHSGGGILSYTSSARMSSNIIFGNRAPIAGGMYVTQLPTWTPAVASNILYGNQNGDADSLTGWTLPDTNRIIDPRLGPGEGIDLWPRSDSPALDAAESGLLAGADFSGQPGPVDSDLDGLVAADVGALENRGEITGLQAAPDSQVPGATVLTWDRSINSSVTFDIYAKDADPFRTDGGFCLASGLLGTTFTDGAIPAPGQARYYLVTGKGVVEGSRGVRSDGTPRPTSPSCFGS